MLGIGKYIAKLARELTLTMHVNVNLQANIYSFRFEERMLINVVGVQRGIVRVTSNWLSQILGKSSHQSCCALYGHCHIKG